MLFCHIFSRSPCPVFLPDRATDRTFRQCMVYLAEISRRPCPLTTSWHAWSGNCSWAAEENASLSVFCTTFVPRNVLTTKNRSDQQEGVGEDRQWLVTAPYWNCRDVPRGGPVPPGLSTGVQSTCCSGNRGLSSRKTTWQITRLQGRDPED